MKNIRKIEITYKKDIGGRDEQQDSCIVLEKRGIAFAVLGDGMGGHSGGSKASQILIETAKNIFEKNFHIENPKELFNKIVLETEKNISIYQKESKLDPHTTVVFALVDGNNIYYGNIGDSRAYIFINNKFIKRSRDHSVTEMLFQAGEITEEEMATHPDQNKLLKSISAEPGSNISYYQYSCDDEDNISVILCSDGLWEYVSTKEMSYCLNTYNIKEAANNMINIAKDKGGKAGDNISIAIIKATSSRKLLKASTSSSNSIQERVRKKNNILKNSEDDNTSNMKKKNFLIYILFTLIIILLSTILFLLRDKIVLTVMDNNESNISTEEDKTVYPAPENNDSNSTDINDSKTIDLNKSNETELENNKTTIINKKTNENNNTSLIETKTINENKLNKSKTNNDKTTATDKNSSKKNFTKSKNSKFSKISKDINKSDSKDLIERMKKLDKNKKTIKDKNHSIKNNNPKNITIDLTINKVQKK